MLAVFICSAGIVNAQTDEETQASKNRIAELLNLNLSSNSGIEPLDKFVNAVQDASDESIAISKSLDEMTQRMNGETDTPSVTELTGLSTRISNLASSTAEASKLSVDAVKSLKRGKKEPHENGECYQFAQQRKESPGNNNKRDLISGQDRFGNDKGRIEIGPFKQPPDSCARGEVLFFRLALVVYQLP